MRIHGKKLSVDRHGDDSFASSCVRGSAFNIGVPTQASSGPNFSRGSFLSRAVWRRFPADPTFAREPADDRGPRPTVVTLQFRPLGPCSLRSALCGQRHSTLYVTAACRTSYASHCSNSLVLRTCRELSLRPSLCRANTDRGLGFERQRAPAVRLCWSKRGQHASHERHLDRAVHLGRCRDAGVALITGGIFACDQPSWALLGSPGRNSPARPRALGDRST